jgi:methylglyoxal/glyoxal reductase
MNHLKLNTDATIPAIGFGTWQIALNRKTRQIVAEALHAGYRLIDTAMIYGNEKGVGQAIREADIARQDISVTTKLWNNDHGYDAAIDAFDRSLTRLGLDYIDLYLMHWPVSGKRLDSWRALEAIYNVGRAKAIGVSNFTVRHLKELLAASEVTPAINQIEFHPYLYREQFPLLEYCATQGIVVEAYSPLAHASNMDDPVIEEISKQVGKTYAQVMLRWAVQHGTIPIPKSSHPERLRQNLDIFDFELSLAQMKRINKLSNGLRTCWDPNTMD